MTTPWLINSEIEDLCEGLTQGAAQIRYLRGLGLPVREKPNGRPLVMRSDVEALGKPAAKPPPARRKPNRQALIELWSKAPKAA